MVEGKVLDVAVDIRRKSPTFGQHISTELTSENHDQLFIPHGFDHGFLALTSNVKFEYKVDNYYSKDHERSISIYDKQLNINWKMSNEKLKIKN
jgi:dTDP-4-dehydrorhamnose 3,5-epimerase